MWVVKLKAINEQTRKTNKNSQTHNNTVVSRRKWVGRWERVKGGTYMVMEDEKLPLKVMFDKQQMSSSVA